MKLIWHCHACFELITDKGSIVFDPYSPKSVRGLLLPELKADAVICSHGHSDHNYAAGVKLTGNETDLSLRRISTFHDGKGGALRGDNLCTVVEAEGLRIAHMGDLGHLINVETAEKFGRVDVLMVPVGGYYTICAQQAKEVATALGARVIVPMHYSGVSTGLENVAPVDDFVLLWDEREVVYLDSNEYEVSLSERRKIVVFAPDSKCIIR